MLFRCSPRLRCSSSRHPTGGRGVFDAEVKMAGCYWEARGKVVARGGNCLGL